MFDSSTISISKSALENNLDFIHNLVADDVIVSSVVKGNAYGHGIETYVPLAMENGVNHFSVYNAGEAYRVKEIVKDKAEIMIMGNMPDDAIEWAIESNVSFFVFSLERLEKSLELAKKIGKKALVHIEVETGMNRTGFYEEDFQTALKLLEENKEYLSFSGLCTHFAGAESIANYVRITEQKSAFHRFKSLAEAAKVIPERYHTCCSAACIRFPEMHMDMVRIGILQFGLWPSREIFIEYLKDKKYKENPLKRLISWKTNIMDIKEVDMGEYVGYGTSYLASKDVKIAMVPVGYAHGFSRQLSNHGRAIVGGVRVSVVGMVNMNCMALDVHEVKNVEIGDEVVLIGEQEGQSISIASFSESSSQVNYEMLTRLPSDIPRIVE